MKNMVNYFRIWLVMTGTMEWIMTFHSVGNVIIPTDVHSIIFQRGRYTTNQVYIYIYIIYNIYIYIVSSHSKNVKNPTIHIGGDIAMIFPWLLFKSPIRKTNYGSRRLKVNHGLWFRFINSYIYPHQIATKFLLRNKSRKSGLILSNPIG